MHIVLVNPEIPQNTGNIARTCAATGSVLHLIKPLGFSLDDRYMKRAGLDYWFLTDVNVHESWRDFRTANPDAEMFFFTTKAKKNYAQVEYPENAYLIFGRETRGLDEDMLICHQDRCVRIPKITEARSLNLSNSVAVALYEALRQRNFSGLSSEGELHGTSSGHWDDYV